MDLNMINKKIAQAIKHEEQNGTAADAVRNLAAFYGKNISQHEVNQVMTFVREYVEHVPYYLKEGKKKAKEQGVQEINDVLEAASSYWALEYDIIPDHLGLVGILDDAYCSLCLLQALSDKCVQESGVPLLPIDLTPANQSMRVLVGEPAATQLDAYVAQTVGTQNMMNVFGALAAAAASGPVFSSGPDPYWGGVSMDEYVNIQMGSMGII